MRNKFFKMLAAVLAVLMSFSVFGCAPDSKDPGIVDNEYTINVKLRKAGYGVTYVDELGKAFEAAYAEEGYKVNVLAPREDLLSSNVYRDIYSNSGVDIYFTGDVTAREAVTGEYGQVFADITESVYNQKAIKADGTEEDKTVAEKLSIYTLDGCHYNNKYYGLPLAESVGGLAVNTKVLDEYDLEVPRTTNEMFKAADIIMQDALETDTFPFTFSLSGNNYTSTTLMPWLAQYGGIEEYNSFWSFQNPDGSNMTTDCYKVWGTESWEKVLEVVYHYYDSVMEAYNSASQTFSEAQNQIMRGTAVFMSNGDWMLNEEYVRNSRYLNDVTFVNAPLISALGVKLFGATTSYGFDDEKCDIVLSSIVKYCDQGRLAAEIKTMVDSELSVNLNVEDVTTVCERRGYVRSNPGLGIALSERSTKKDIATLFLRFCASQDGGRIFAEQSRSMSPYARNVNANPNYAWTNSVYNILNNPYVVNLDSSVRGYRLSMGVTTLTPGLGDPYSTSLQGKVTKYNPDTLKIVATDAVYTTIAKKTAKDMFDYAKEQVETNKWKVMA